MIFNDGYLNIHKVMTGGLESSCNFCEKNFFTKRFFQHGCHLCNTTSIGTCEELVQHLKKVHTTKKPYLCLICGFTFQDVSKQKNHIRMHTGAKPYSCNICNSKFRCSHNLKEHRYNHLKEKQFECNICKNKYLSPGKLKRHRKLHEKEPNKKNKCKLCDKKFAQSSYLKEHHYTHLEGKQLECS